tara:strand:+ start:4747 stop:5016 length:270 start_codon:yes stop_codon:yes gene_type:complete
LNWLTCRRAAERRGVEKRPLGRAIPGRAVSIDQRSLEQEFEYLYHQREGINARMSAIRAELTEAEYQALVKKIEKPQLAVLKKSFRSDG